MGRQRKQKPVVEDEWTRRIREMNEMTPRRPQQDQRDPTPGNETPANGESAAGES